MTLNINKVLKLVDSLIINGKILRAKTLLQENLRVYPNHSKLTKSLASILGNQGDIETALSLLRGVSENKDFSWSGFYDLGLLYLKKQKFDEAIQYFKRALEKNEGSFETHFYLALALVSKDLFNDAKSHLLIARKINPSSPEVNYNLGRIFDALGNFDQACTCYEAATKLNPSFIEAWVNLGLAFYQQGKYQAALESYKTAIKINNFYQDAWLNMGTTLHELNQFDEALLAYDWVLKINPNSDVARWNRAQIDLTVGNFERGWDGYEYRAYGQYSKLGKYSNIPKAKNLTEIIGKKILVWHEQGYGDTIQFSRFLGNLNSLGCQVTLEVPLALLSLMCTLGNCVVVSEITEESSFDFQIPLMSLPKLFNINPYLTKVDIPYLHVKPALVAEWEKRLNIDKNIVNIGLAVSGSVLHSKNSKRSVRLDELEEILSFGKFYLLQTELTEIDKAYLSERSEIVFCGNLINSFQDSAAILKSMDIVISVDTSLAHLSGALNIETIILLPWVAEWRWQEKSISTVWYPNTTLCRQDVIGDWNSAVKKIQSKMTGCLIKGRHY